MNPRTTNPDVYSTIVATDLIPITTSDTVDLERAARAIRVGTGGTLRITTLRGEVRNTNVIDGEVLLVGVTRVHATGTTATGLEALV